jgi:hypothetical protein
MVASVAQLVEQLTLNLKQGFAPILFSWIDLVNIGESRFHSRLNSTQIHSKKVTRDTSGIQSGELMTINRADASETTQDHLRHGKERLGAEEALLLYNW